MLIAGERAPAVIRVVDKPGGTHEGEVARRGCMGRDSLGLEAGDRASASRDEVLLLGIVSAGTGDAFLFFINRNGLRLRLGLARGEPSGLARSVSVLDWYPPRDGDVSKSRVPSGDVKPTGSAPGTARLFDVG